MKPDYYDGQICPKCGRHLIIKEGQFGDFLACPRFPLCRFTKPLPDGDLKIYQPPSSYCSKCNHSGLIPFKNEEGKVIPYTFTHCDCHPIYGANPEVEHYHSVSSEDYDFSMSYSVYRSLCQQHGWADPGPDKPDMPDIPLAIKSLRPTNKELIDKAHRLEVLISDLQNHLNVHIDKSKAKGKY